jgi:alkaline phosphatase
VITEYLAFDSAVAEACAFARENGNTEVLLFPDHDNGGMSLGRRGDNYTSTDPQRIINCISKCTMTAKGLLDSLIRYKKAHGTVDWRIVADHLASCMGIDSIGRDDDIFGIAESANNSNRKHDDVARIGSVISRRCDIGWTTYGHTGNDVPMFSMLLQNRGVFDNTDIARYCAHIMKIDMKDVNEKLITSVDELFGGENIRS